MFLFIFAHLKLKIKLEKSTKWLDSKWHNI